MENLRFWQVALVVTAVCGFCSASHDLVSEKVAATVENSVRIERSAVSSPSGSVYTRWGRTSCPSTSRLVYEGFAAGTNYNTAGGGSNYLCMPLDPEYNKFSSGGDHSVLSGAEYQTWNSYGVFPASAHDKNVPCARCYTQGTAMMIPAKRSCPSRWTKEYDGYLMAALTSENHHSRTYECVDATPEYINGNSDNSDGALFYFVKPDCEGRGRTAHCPRYIPDRQLTCVVCS